MVKGYDPKCYELAEYFLSRPGEAIDPRKADYVAQAIQDAAEDALSDVVPA